MSSYMKLSTLLFVLAFVFILGACSNENNNDAKAGNNVQPSTVSTTDKNAIKEGTIKLQDETKKLQDAIDNKDAGEVKHLAKSINEVWLSYENIVRQTFPLEYTEVEKYEMPIFSASAYDKVDLDVLKVTANKMQEALVAVLNAKETTGNTSELLAKAVDNYKVYIEEQASQLVSQTKVFVEAVKAGDKDKAKLEYPKARVFFETI